MMREVLKAKIHRLTVVASYSGAQGSHIVIDEDLMDIADITEHEKISVVNITKGSRFDTYAVRGVRGSGIVCINGETAQMSSKGDIIALLTYKYIPEESMKTHKPRLVLVDNCNKIVSC